MDELQSTSQGPCSAQVLGIRVDAPHTPVLVIKETIRFGSPVFFSKILFYRKKCGPAFIWILFFSLLDLVEWPLIGEHLIGPVVHGTNVVGTQRAPQ